MREKDYYGAIKGFCLKWNLPEVWNSDRITGANLIYEVIKVINAMIVEQKAMKEMIEDFLLMFNEDLSDTVKDQLTVWLNDGTLDNIINETLFNSKLDKDIYDTFNTQYQIDLNKTNNFKTDNVLNKNTKVTIIGDSIARGKGSTSETGIKKQLEDRFNGIVVNNYGVDSTSLNTTDTRPNIQDQLDQVPTDTDLLLIHCGVNDITSSIDDKVWRVGYEWGDSAGKFSLKNNDTSINVLENIFINYQVSRPNMKIMFIISGSVATPLTWVYDSGFNSLVNVCYKYDIPVLDMRKYMPNKNNDAKYSLYNADYIHPNDKGYSLYTDKIIGYINSGYSDAEKKINNTLFVEGSNIYSVDRSVEKQKTAVKNAIKAITTNHLFVNSGNIIVSSLGSLSEVISVDYVTIVDHVSFKAYCVKLGKHNAVHFSGNIEFVDRDSDVIRLQTMVIDRVVYDKEFMSVWGIDSFTRLDKHGTYLMDNATKAKMTDLPSVILSNPTNYTTCETLHADNGALQQVWYVGTDVYYLTKGTTATWQKLQTETVV